MTAAIHDNSASATEPVPISLGQVKRVLEWWSSSETFRKTVQADPEQAMRDFPIDINPELIRPLWDHLYAVKAQKENLPLHPAVPAYRAFVSSKTSWRGEIKEECSPDEPRFRAWRQRQIARNSMEHGGYDDYIIHTPLSIELTDGCSVGCWFCGVGATKVGESHPYDQQEWRSIVQVLRNRIGTASKWGFLYWATDPLDNPEYEKFANDFTDIVGMFPQTTTAQGHKNPERTRRILQMSEARGCRVNRFSVLTEPLLRQIHTLFTADEMLNVEVVSQMQGSTTAKADSGAFRVIAKDKKRVTELEMKKLETLVETQRSIAAEAEADIQFAVPPQPGTIACVSGFLLNMVKRTVKLISPCRANDDWPLGYIVFEERTFTDAADLDRKITEIMEEHMPMTLDPAHPMRLNPGLDYAAVERGFHVSSKMNAMAFLREDLAPYLQSVGGQVARGKKTAGEIALSAFFEHGVPEINTIGTLAVMFEKGLVADAKGRSVGIRV
jgi:radical SAM family RiPP maturation amino acid epimerase